MSDTCSRTSSASRTTSTNSEDSDTEEEKEVNKVDRDHVWPGTSVDTRRRDTMVKRGGVKDR